MDGLIVVRWRFESLMRFVVLLFLETCAQHLGSSFAYLSDHQDNSLLVIRPYVSFLKGFHFDFSESIHSDFGVSIAALFEAYTFATDAKH